MIRNEMDSECTPQQLMEALDEKVELAHKILLDLRAFSIIDGAQKLERKIKQELKFLLKIKKSQNIELQHIMCSNLPHFNSLVKSLHRYKNITSIEHPLPITDKKCPHRIDIVCDNGSTWVKVIARNAKSLSDAVNGRDKFGKRSILDKAEELNHLSEMNQIFFKPPKVIFEFANQIEDELIQSLRELSIDVRIVNSSPTEMESSAVYTSDDIETITTVNLDITTMIAYVSAVTNGNPNLKFKETILTEQAQREREKPLKPTIDNIFKGKQLICCETAVASFNEIVNLLAGPGEKKRAAELLDRVQILPDVDEIHPDLERLSLGGKIKPRSFTIFAFGMHHKAITITSNEGFIRSAKMQGLAIPVYVHEARALTEGKEQTAIKL